MSETESRNHNGEKETISATIRIDADTHQTLKRYCEIHGLMLYKYFNKILRERSRILKQKGLEIFQG